MKKLVQWFVDNPIASNLLMLVILVGGISSGMNLQKEVFPQVDQNYIDISMAYPGAGPREVEQQIAVRIEESIADVAGIKQITSDSRQGLGSVSVEVTVDANPQDVLNEVKAQVDAINTFPASSERPVVQRRVQRVPVAFFALYGDASERVIKEYGQQLRDDLALQPDISVVTISGMRDDEVSIEISEESLRRFDLNFDQVADAIRRSSLNLPAGTLQTDSGNIQVQTRAQAYTESDFDQIVIRSRSDGSRLLLGDIASVRDGFAEQNRKVGFNGKYALAYAVYIADNKPDLYAATEQTRKILTDAEKYLPENIAIEVTFELKTMFDERLELLSGNAISGLILVFIVLMLFLRPMLAVWVCVGIVISFAGAIWLMPYVGMSLNMISMFAFLMVLGIVVDDAIIVGESIYSSHDDGLQGTQAAAQGAKNVSKPVLFAILSTIIFFMPMLDLPPELAPMTYPIAVVVIICLVFSLIESLFILPMHLAHMKPERDSKNIALQKLSAIRHWLSGGLKNIADNIYRPALHKMLHNNAATAVSFVLMLALSVVIFKGLPQSFFPTVPNDFISVNVTLPEGTSFRETQRITAHIAQSAKAMRTDETLRQLNGPGRFMNQVTTNADENNISVFVGLFGADTRNVSTEQVVERLRDIIGPLPEAKKYSLDFSQTPNIPDIQLNMSVASNSIDVQQAVIADIGAALNQYEGVINVRNSLDAGQVEVEMGIKADAEALGITVSDIAHQTRQSFYGEEVQRIPRSKEDVRVMLRYPAEERRSLDQLNIMRIRNADNIDIPLLDVANVELVPGFTSIQRVDRRRTIGISAEVKSGVDANVIVDDLLTKHLDKWKRQHTGFELSIDGGLRTQGESNTQMLLNMMMALLAVYVIMAIAFRSYFQPLLILTAIPFGFMGAVIGHKLLGHEISLMSQLGFLACAGVVINDNLVLLDRINQLREQSKSAFEAVLNAGRDRFRAIILTSLTTFIGLMPILFEQSVQARFLIPMVISLSFGVLFATTVTLILVPSLYLSGHNIGQWFKVVTKRSSERLEKKTV